jgi:large repetitive protein
VAAPQIITFEPPASGTAGGQIVSLFGNALDTVTAVNFGVQPALVFSAYPVSGHPTYNSRIDAVAPPGEGTAVISVTSPGGSTSTGPGSFTWVDPTTVAIVSSVSPLGGGAGTAVTIRGSGFSGAVAVNFGTTAAADFEVDGDSQISAWAPAGGVGLVDVTVIASGGASAASIADHFTYIPLKPPKPAPLSLSPNYGSVAGGTFVTLLGSGFTNATSVTFAGLAAQFDVVSDGKIVAASPPAPGGTPQAVDILVTTPIGVSTAVPGDGFTYTVAPAVTQLEPSEAPYLGGTAVVIGGSGFSGADAVLFGVTPAVFQVWSDGVVTATAPPGIGLVQVAVRTTRGLSAAGPASQFTYTAIPAVAQLTPQSGPVAGGTSVVINGQGFTGATTVAFGGVVAPAFTVDSDAQITAISPPGSGVVDVTVITSAGVSPVTVADRFTYL